jgi:hypothetical protein
VCFGIFAAIKPPTQQTKNIPLSFVFALPAEPPHALLFVLFGPFGTGLFLDDDDDDGSIIVTIHDVVVVVAVVPVAVCRPDVRLCRRRPVDAINEIGGKVVHHDALSQWRGWFGNQKANDGFPITVVQDTILPVVEPTPLVQYQSIRRFINVRPFPFQSVLVLFVAFK